MGTPFEPGWFMRPPLFIWLPSTLLAVVTATAFFNTAPAGHSSQLSLADQFTHVTDPMLPHSPVASRSFHLRITARQAVTPAFPRHSIVDAGDTLTSIAQAAYGNPADWTVIYYANRELIGQNYSAIQAGWRLLLPAAPDEPPAPPVSPAQPVASSSSAQSPYPAAGGGLVSTSGMAAFEACVIARESGGNPRAVNPYSGAGGLFQFLPSTWASLGYAASYPGGAQTAPVSVQEAAFAQLYAQAGTAPWASDGC